MDNASHFRTEGSSLADSAIEQQRRIAADLNTSVQLVAEPLSTPREHDPPLSAQRIYSFLTKSPIISLVEKKKHASLPRNTDPTSNSEVNRCRGVLSTTVGDRVGRRSVAAGFFIPHVGARFLKKNIFNVGIFVRFWVLAFRSAIVFASGHTATNTPDLFRTPKLTVAGPGQYWGGGPPGKSFGCCQLFTFLFKLNTLL